MKKMCLSLTALLLFTTSLVAQSTNQLMQKGDDCYKNKDYTGALNNYTKVTSALKDNKLLAVAYDKIAQCEHKLDQYQKAIDDENKAIKFNPENINLYWNRGLVYQSLTDYNLAIADYTRALPFYKDDHENSSILYHNIANCYLKLKGYANVVKNDSLALVHNPKNGSSFWNIGIAHANLKQYEQAIKDYKNAKLYQDDREDISILYDNIAVNERVLNRYQEAIDDESSALYFNPDNATAYWNRAMTYGLNGDYQLAINDYTKAMNYHKNSKGNMAILYNNCALNELALKHYDKAAENNAKALEINPQNGFFHWICADIYSAVGKHQQAVKAYKETMVFYSKYKKVLADLHNSCANNSYYLNDNKEALKECSAAIKADSTFMPAYFTRGKVYLKKLKNKEAAEKDFRKVLQTDTNKTSVSYVLALYYTGDADAALKQMNAKILSNTNQNDILSDYYNMACLLSLMNRLNEANTYLKIAIDKGYSKTYAYYDDDLENIRKTPDFISLIGNGIVQP